MSLPIGWADAALKDIVAINPANPDVVPTDDTMVSFVPMASVEALTGRLDPSKQRPWREVRKGFSKFQEGDVVVAKITPSMENGKAAIAHGLANELGAGTTELHVLRPRQGIEPRFLLHYVLQESFRRQARARMTGTAGQLRVPTAFLEEQRVPLPPTAEQVRLVATLDSMLSRLDAATGILEAAQRKLKSYRASLLKAAIEGRLVPTEATLARTEGRSYEPAGMLLGRIRKERCRYREDAALARAKANGKAPTQSERLASSSAPNSVDDSALPMLPEGWTWAPLETLCSAIVDCPHSTPVWTDSGRVCVRTTEFRPGYLDLTTARFVSDESYAQRIARLRPQPGDILYSREGGILGLACQIPVGVDLCLGQRMMLLRAADGLGRYIMHVLNSPWIVRIVRRLTGGSASPHLNVRDVKRFPVPLPPLSEAARIVDQLEWALSIADGTERQAEADRGRLMRLRQSILMSAFDGKLVGQDPAEEPAEALLTRIRAGGATGTKTRRLRRLKA
jgi:type I restriction enzyme S subunit